MAYSCEFFTPRVNYFSNPDISVLGRVTGTPTEDNARVIRDNMVREQTSVTVSLTRDAVLYRYTSFTQVLHPLQDLVTCRVLEGRRKQH